MLRLQGIFKNYAETGALNAQLNLFGFIDDHIFLTKTGDLGVILEVRGVDYECLDGATLDGLTKRLESALKLFGEDYRIYQYLFKRNNPSIPHRLYGNPVVDTAIRGRIAYLQSKADALYGLFTTSSYSKAFVAHHLQNYARLFSCLGDFTFLYIAPFCIAFSPSASNTKSSKKIQFAWKAAPAIFPNAEPSRSRPANWTN